jgi:hypothetical protein
MEFCEICQNMIYIRTDTQHNLVKYCKNCKTKQTMEATAPGRMPYKICQSLYSDDDMLYLQHQNKYLRYDPTLPRICDASLRCPAADCEGAAAGAESRLLYVKYHPVDLKYLYCCDYCGTCGLYEEFKVKK